MEMPKFLKLQTALQDQSPSQYQSPFSKSNSTTIVYVSLHAYSGYYEAYLFQVSTNGFISFEPPPDTLRITSFRASTIPLIAPLWADFDFRESGAVYHRVSQDPYILQQVSSIIAAENHNFASFNPTLCVIVTWTQAVLFSDFTTQVRIAMYNKHEMKTSLYVPIFLQQTFQAVLATDATAAFVILTYHDPQQTISITSDQRGIGVIAFVAGDLRRSTTILSSEQTSFPLKSSNIFRIDGEELV